MPDFSSLESRLVCVENVQNKYYSELFGNGQAGLKVEVSALKEQVSLLQDQTKRLQTLLTTIGLFVLTELVVLVMDLLRRI